MKKQVFFIGVLAALSVLHLSPLYAQESPAADVPVQKEEQSEQQADSVDGKGKGFQLFISIPIGYLTGGLQKDLQDNGWNEEPAYVGSLAAGLGLGFYPDDRFGLEASYTFGVTTTSWGSNSATYNSSRNVYNYDFLAAGPVLRIPMIVQGYPFFIYGGGGVTVASLALTDDFKSDISNSLGGQVYFESEDATGISWYAKAGFEMYADGIVFGAGIQFYVLNTTYPSSSTAFDGEYFAFLLKFGILF